MTEEQLDKITNDLLDELANKTGKELQKDVDKFNKVHGICPSSCAPDENSVCEENGESIDTMDVIDEILDNPKKTLEEKDAYLKEVEERRQRLKDLERENQEWQEFKKPYIEEAINRAKSDYEALKAFKKEPENQKVRTNVKKSNNIH